MRIKWLDMSKGYGMLLVVIAHLSVGVIGCWINSFHIPLFFFLSGYVFSAKYEFRVFVKKKTKSLLQPYFFLGISLIVFSEVVDLHNGEFTVNSLIQLIRQFLIQRRMWTLWFLTTLFVINILYYVLIRVLKTEKRMAVVALLFPIVGVAYYKWGGYHYLGILMYVLLHFHSFLLEII